MDREHSEDYKKYLRSERWKKFRREIIAYRAYRCQDCLQLGTGYSLEVHHLHYETLGREAPKDVLVLCHKCHQKADRERKVEAERDRQAKLYEARLDGWASKVYGDNWADYQDYEMVSDEFDEWLERHND